MMGLNCIDPWERNLRRELVADSTDTRPRARIIVNMRQDGVAPDTEPKKAVKRPDSTVSRV